jgi:galactonate dehydratase
MRRREVLQGAAAALLAGSARAGRNPLDCGCGFQMQAAIPAGAFDRVGSRLRVSAMKVFGVTLNGQSDRPYVFVKLETNQGLVGWGEGTLEGKAGAVIACVNDFRDFVVGADPMQVEHIWQSMYVHSFYRGGPVMGSAISGIDQALWDIRGKALGMPVYKLLGGPFDSRHPGLLPHQCAYPGRPAEAARDGRGTGSLVLQDRPGRIL